MPESWTNKGQCLERRDRLVPASFFASWPDIQRPKMFIRTKVRAAATALLKGQRGRQVRASRMGDMHRRRPRRSAPRQGRRRSWPSAGPNRAAGLNPAHRRPDWTLNIEKKLRSTSVETWISRPATSIRRCLSAKYVVAACFILQFIPCFVEANTALTSTCRKTDAKNSFDAMTTLSYLLQT